MGKTYEKTGIEKHVLFYFIGKLPDPRLTPQTLNCKKKIILRKLAALLFFFFVAFDR